MASMTQRTAQAQLALAILIARADGLVDEREMEAAAHHIAGSLEGLDPKQLAAHVRAITDQARDHGPRTALSMVAADLPDPKDRLDAVHLALEVARADGRLDRAEADRILAVSELLGLPPEFLPSLKAGLDTAP